MNKFGIALRITLFIFILSISKYVYGFDYCIDNYNIDAVLLNNGDIKLEEKIIYNFKGDVNGIFRDVMYKYDVEEDSYEPESSRYMASNAIFEKTLYSNTSFDSLLNAKLEDERKLYNGVKGKYLITNNKNLIRNKLYLPSKYGDKKYIKYNILLKDVVCNYNDAAEIYWNFIGDNFECDINNLQINIRTEDNNKILKLYPHTYATISDSYIKNNIATVKLEYLESETPLDVRLVVDNNNFNTSKMINENYNYDLVTKIEDEMQKGKENLIKFKNRTTKLVFLGIITSGIIILFAFFTKKKKTLSYSKVEYNSELLEGLEIGEYSNIISNIGYSSPNSLNATLLDLINKKYINFNPRKELIKEKEQYKYYISLNSKMYDKYDNLSEYEKLLINYIFNKNISFDKIENNTEFELNDRFKEISKDTTLITNFTREVNKIEKKKNENKHSERIGDIAKITFIIALIFFIIELINLFTLYPKDNKIGMFGTIFIIFVFSIIITLSFALFARHKVDDKYAETYNKLLGLKKYLNDYSLIKEKMPIELVLWEKYMVFATLFGISKKVLKEFKEELINNGYDAEYINTYPTYVMLNTFTNGKYLSSISTMYSSTSGGYSGTGSGGGGGRRWWWRCFLEYYEY